MTQNDLDDLLYFLIDNILSAAWYRTERKNN